MLFLPALCRKMGVPYCIVKGKSRLGQVVHRKNAACLAFTQVNPEDKSALSKLVDAVRTNYNDRYEEVCVSLSFTVVLMLLIFFVVFLGNLWPLLTFFIKNL